MFPPSTSLKTELFNAEVLIREDITVDEFIDVVLGNRRYITCLYVCTLFLLFSLRFWLRANQFHYRQCFNKIDQVC